MKRVINLDMDGVVADFNAFTSEILGRQIGWEGRDLSDDEWVTLANIPNLYNKLPLIKESVPMVEFALQQKDFDVRFLTAIPRRTTIETAEQDKRDWLARHFPGIPMEIGPYSKHKQNWANPLDILVDDKKSNVLEWLSKGGISVYHTGNWQATITNLKEATQMDTPVCLGALGK